MAIHKLKKIKNIRLLRSKLQVLIKKYTFSIHNSNENSPAIISFTADGLVKQGGLVDRLKGILSVYSIVKLHGNILFKINFTSPFNISDFLEPNMVDWRTDTEVKYKFPFHKPYYFVDDFNDENIKKVLVKIKKGRRFDVYYNIDMYRSHPEKASIHNMLFWELFKISPRLKNELDSFKIPDNSIAVHIRFLNNFGDFSSYLPPTSSFVKSVLSNHQKTILVKKFEEALNNIIREAGNLQVVLFSDSNYFIENISVKIKERLLIIPGEVRQSEDGTQTGFDAHKKTFIDFFLMAQCTNVIMLKSNETYNSSFSEYAAIVGGKPFEVKNI